MPSKKIEYNCTHCNALFIRGKSDIEKTFKKNNTVFCSISCSREYSNKIQLEKGFSENKICKKCNIEKPRTSDFFPKNCKTLDHFDSWCKPCRATYRNEFRRGNYRNMISDGDLVNLLKTKNCTICGSEEKLVVDHCHNENFVRGMLCNNCNRGLGQFRDKPYLLEFARIYLLANSKDEEDIKEYNEYMKQNCK
jgi:hypothetical protein